MKDLLFVVTVALTFTSAFCSPLPFQEQQRQKARISISGNNNTNNNTGNRGVGNVNNDNSNNSGTLVNSGQNNNGNQSDKPEDAEDLVSTTVNYTEETNAYADEISLSSVTDSQTPEPLEYYM